MVQYPSTALAILKKARCPNCNNKVLGWNEEVYSSWLKYLNGKNRDQLIKDTSFSNYVSLKYHFKKHPCYKKIAYIRKRYFRIVKTTVKNNIEDHPWLLGFYYADGFTRTNRTQLAFVPSKNEEIIADRIEKELKSLLEGEICINRDYIDNMIQVRTHSCELARSFPDKKSEKQFKKIWDSLNTESKKKLIAGFIDGDGSCQFDVGVNSIQVYSKIVPFILRPFKEFLSYFGHVSQQNYNLYLSPNIGKLLKPYIEKRNISSPYEGKVDTKKAFNFLKNDIPMREIARQMHKDRKTISLALKKVYGPSKIQIYLNRYNTKLNSNR
ncbi:MAG: hypothetical protein NTX24_04760 [Candidatus Pacearchaeota archaeon]|nr:hypothetical protein [Candidatus Pacearchaeota archaeon]